LGYTEAIARADNGELSGNWTQDSKLLFEKDGGHGMLFRTFGGKLMLTLHSPNTTPDERPKFFELEEIGDTLALLR
jgi:hypothetical protein